MMQKKVFILSACFLLLLCSVVMSNAESAPEYVPNEIIIKFKAAVEQDMSMSIANKSVQQPSLALLMTKNKIMKATSFFRERAGKTSSQGRELYRDMINKARAGKGLPAIDTVDLSNVYLLQVEDGTDILAAVSEFSADPNVEYAEPNYIMTIDTDPDFYRSWGLDNTGTWWNPTANEGEGEWKTNGVVDADIDSPEAWAYIGSNLGQKVIVAVIDTGVDYNHEDLITNMWTDESGNYGYDYYNDDNDPIDDNGHGTHAAGIIGAIHDNDYGSKGVSGNVKIMALKACGSGGGCDGFAISQSATYAISNGSRVINASLGEYQDSDDLLQDAVTTAFQHDVVFVASAGNGKDFCDGTYTKCVKGVSTCSCITYPVNTDDDGDVDTPLVDDYFPAGYTLDSYGYTNVLAVAASTVWDTITTFSNYGLTTVDLAAPGQYIYSTYPGNTYKTISGTSMAAPHVAGVAALILAQSPIDSPMKAFEVVDLIKNSVDVKDTLSGKFVSNGRLNAYNALANSCPNKPVIIVNGTSYPTLQAAYDNVATVNGDTIQIQAVQLVEDINLAIIKTITIQGGYNCDFTEITGYTRINGNGTIGEGEITVKDIIFQK